MADENQAVNDFLAGLSNDGSQNPLDETPQDPFKVDASEQKEELAETEEAVTEKKDVKPLPFHKDPKVQRYIEEEISKRIPEQEPLRDKPLRTNKLDEFATKLFGDDTPENIAKAKDFKEIIQGIYEESSLKAVEVVEAERKAEADQEAIAERTLLNGFESIEQEYGIDMTSSSPQARKYRGEFVNFIRKVAPKDEYGDVVDFPDLLGTFETFQTLKKSSNASTRAKELASRSNERGSSVESSDKPKQRLSWDSDIWEKTKESLFGK